MRGFTIAMDAIISLINVIDATKMAACNAKMGIDCYLDYAGRKFFEANIIIHFLKIITIDHNKM